MSPVFAIRRLFQVVSRLFLALSLLALFSFPARTRLIFLRTPILKLSF